MTDLRVLQVASSPEAFFEQQVNALEEAGVDCTTLVVSDPAGEADPRGIGDYVTFYRKLLDERTGEYDIVHANYGLIGPLALAQPRRPVVLTLWGSEVMGYSRRLDRITRVSARLSDAVIVPNQAVSDQLSCDHTVIPFAVDLDQFEPRSRVQACRSLGWDPHELVVLFPYDPNRSVKRYDLARNVVQQSSIPATLRTVYGRPYGEMPLVLNASDVLLVASERESGPMVVREAAACNVPVVSTDVGFAEETLAPVSNCFVSDDPADLVSGLEAALRSNGRTNGRDVVREYGPDRLARQLLAVYDDALGTERTIEAATEIVSP